MGPVLIVEDDPAIRSVVQEALNDDGYKTVVADNGADALDLVETCRPACVLLDLHLPVLDGYGFLRSLDGKTAGVPVLLMTSDPAGRDLGPADGVIGHIPKPFDLDHLSTAVAMVTQARPDLRQTVNRSMGAGG